MRSVRRPRKLFLFPLLCILGFLPFSASAKPPAEIAAPHSAAMKAVASSTLGVVGSRVNTVDGEVLHLGFTDRAAPIALVFLEDECVISRRYVPRLNELSQEAKKLGVELYAVISNPAVAWRSARDFRDEYELALPLIFDSNGELGRLLQPEFVPQAFVLDLQDRVVYRGRIDDRFPSLTKIRPEATTHDLLDAMNAVASGDVVTLRETEAVGCAYVPWPEKPKQPTYTKDVAPILNANCVECHQDGGVAPFSLSSYAQAKRWSKMTAGVTAERLMPPWKAERGYGSFREERFLSARQIAILAGWNDAGAPEGDPEHLLPEPPPAAQGWKLGEPDLVLTMPEEYSLPADGEDIYRYFVLPMNLVRDEVVVAMDFRPGNAAVVHHANFFVDYEGKARKADQEDPAPGFSVFGTGGFMSYTGAGALGAWAPGVAPYRMPEGRGFDLPQGGDVVLEVHYHLTGKKETDRSSFAFYFADGPVERGVGGLYLGTQDVFVPADRDDYWRHFHMDVPAEMQLVDIAPHMHYLGAEAKVTATLPGGEVLPLLHVTDWDLRWQGLYTYREPVRIPAGSKLDAWIRFDNTRWNVDNPHSPPKDVAWGWGSDEEMAELYLTIIADRDANRRLQRAAWATWSASADPAVDKTMKKRDACDWYEQLLAAEFWTWEGRTLLRDLSASPDFSKVLDLSADLREKAQNPARAQALHGMLLYSASFYESDPQKQWDLGTAADEAFEAALQADRKNWNALLGRAGLYAASQEPSWMQEAARLYRRMIEDPDASSAQAVAYLRLGEVYQELGKETKARETWEEGGARFPEDRRLRRKLQSGQVVQGGSS